MNVKTAKIMFLKFQNREYIVIDVKRMLENDKSN